MKQFIIVGLLMLTTIACKKKDEIYKVKFSVTGNSVNDFKFNYGNTINTYNKEPFSGTRDTTIYLGADKAVTLDAKSTGGPLTGRIYVNDDLVLEQTDSDIDKDGKTQVKIDYTIK
jgi:hypothetical protein